MQANAVLLSLRCPVQHAQPFFPNAVQHSLMELVFRRLRQRLRSECQFANLATTKRLQRALGVIPLDDVRLLEQMRTGTGQGVNIDGNRLQDTRIRGVAPLQQERRNQPLMTRQGIIAVQHRPHTICQLVATVQPAPTRNPVRKRLR